MDASTFLLIFFFTMLGFGMAIAFLLDSDRDYHDRLDHEAMIAHAHALRVATVTVRNLNLNREN